MSITPEALQVLLDELEASRAPSKQAWEVLQEIRWVRKDTSGVELPPPSRKTIDLEGICRGSSGIVRLRGMAEHFGDARAARETDTVLAGHTRKESQSDKNSMSVGVADYLSYLWYMSSSIVARIAETKQPYEIGSRSPYQTDRLSIKDDIISLGVAVVSLELTTHSMMQWSLWHSGTKTHIEP
jgi:hypothetical protein